MAKALFHNDSENETSGISKNASIDANIEYRELITSIESLAKVGAGFGQYDHFFMYVCCEKDRVFINMEVKFGDQLNWLNRNLDCLEPKLNMLGVTENEYYTFMRVMRIVSEDARHDVGTLKIQEQLLSPRHCRAVYDALKNRLVNIAHTRHSVEEKNGQFSIFLHEE